MKGSRLKSLIRSFAIDGTLPDNIASTFGKMSVFEKESLNGIAIFSEPGAEAARAGAAANGYSLLENTERGAALLAAGGQQQKDALTCRTTHRTHRGSPCS